MIKYQTIFIAVLIGIIPALGASWWFLTNGQKKIGINLLLKTFFWGVLTAIPASIFQIINIEGKSGNMVVSLLQQLVHGLNNYFITHSLVPFLFVALIEEFSKGLGIFLSLRSFARSKKASNLKINPGILVGIIVGLAFGVTENGVYFANNFGGQIENSIVSIVVLRFLLSTSAHMIYSGLFGAFLVDLFVAKGVVKKILSLGGMSLPIIIHTTFNILVTTSNLGILSIPLLLVGLVILSFKTFWTASD